MYKIRAKIESHDKHCFRSSYIRIKNSVNQIKKAKNGFFTLVLLLNIEYDVHQFHEP